MLKQVAVGAALAVLGGALACSGDDKNANDAGSDSGPPDVAIDYYVKETAPPTPTLVDIAAGAQHTCAIVAYGGQYVTYCFGADAALGGTKQGLFAAASTGTGTAPTFLSIASGPGAGHTCAIDTQKQVWCWGDDSLGQCGQGNPHANIATPLVALDYQLGVAKATELVAGASSTCIVRSSDSKLLCFGDNASCETDLYDGSGCSAGATSATGTTDDGVVFHDVSAIGVGPTHGCVSADPLPSGSPALFCFGDNAFLESGPSGKTITTPAALIASPRKVASVAVGDAHTCFVTSAPQALYCFGKNDVHQADPTSATTPIDPQAPALVTLPQSAAPSQVFARGSETCVLDLNGALWCFGQGHGANVDAVAGVKDVGKVAFGSSHTCVIGHLPSDQTTAPGELICWGDNTSGQAGQTAGTPVTTPTPVAIPASAPN